MGVVLCVKQLTCCALLNCVLLPVLACCCCCCCCMLVCPLSLRLHSRRRLPSAGGMARTRLAACVRTLHLGALVWLQKVSGCLRCGRCCLVLLRGLDALAAPGCGGCRGWE